MKILIIANSRYKGGLSGSDAIYENFKKYWPVECVVCDMQGTEYKPFLICYAHRILLACIRALFDTQHYDLVYSASDFLPDVLPAIIYRIKGARWIAGFYLAAFRDNPAHYYTQKVVRKLIQYGSNMVIVTNHTMFRLFPRNKKTWINGGVDLSLVGEYENKKYDAVFCGRIHPSKGIDELLEIWDLVRKEVPKARLAIIGDGDMGVGYIKHKLYAKHGLKQTNGIDLLGYMGTERYEVYKKSRMVLYPTPIKYDHFSMAPVEAMACGCPLLHFHTPIIRKISPEGHGGAATIESFADNIIYLIRNNIARDVIGSLAKVWASQFDYKNQSMRVWKEIEKEIYEDIDNRGTRNARKFSMPYFKRTPINNPT